jgi:hypothetical protein
MPFTFSHPAAILPATLLPKRYYSLTGLIAGSVAPDFEYFIRMSVESDYSHTIAGIFWFNLPLAFLLAVIYHEIVRDPLIGSLPGFFRQRLEPFQSFEWMNYVKKNWPVVIGSIIIGSGSHLLWDSFTHAEGYFAQIIPWLSADYNILGHAIAGFKIAQHASTLAGMLVLLIYIYKLPADKASIKHNYTGYWWIVVLITVLFIVLKVTFGIERHLANHIIIAGMSGSMFALVVTPVLLKVRIKGGS